MRAVVYTSNYRNAENWLELFQSIDTAGGSCKIAYLLWTGDPSFAASEPLALPICGQKLISHLSRDGISEERLNNFVDETCDSNIDVVFICDMQSYPSSAIYHILRKRSVRPIVIGLQHGLFQSWERYNQNFCADHLLCFGEHHRKGLLPAFRARSVAVGLPKLDRLERVETSDAGYILHIAQKGLDPNLTIPLLKNIEAKTGLPVVVRNHPQYPDLINHVSTHPLPLVNATYPEKLTFVEQLANANWVLTGYSTGGLEALYLRKPVVLVPTTRLIGWPYYSGVARNFSIHEVLSAHERVLAEHEQTKKFLEVTMGGLRFDHTKRALTAVRSILSG